MFGETAGNRTQVAQVETEYTKYPRALASSVCVWCGVRGGVRGVVLCCVVLCGVMCCFWRLMCFYAACH